MHPAQEDLGYTKFSIFHGLYQIYFSVDGQKKKNSTRYDSAGCSSGGYKMFGPLLVNNCVRFGFVGNALPAIMPAKESFEVIKSHIKTS